MRKTYKIGQCKLAYQLAREENGSFHIFRPKVNSISKLLAAECEICVFLWQNSIVRKQQRTVKLINKEEIN